MLIKYSDFIEKIKNAEFVRVIGSFYIDYTSDITKVINSIKLLEEKSAGIVFEPLYYNTKNIHKQGIMLGRTNKKNLYCIEVDDCNFEIQEFDGKYFSIASCDYMTVLEIEQLIKVGYISLEKCLKMVRKSFEKW